VTVLTAPADAPERFGQLRTERRVGVLGGGALGLGAALRLAQAGRQVTLIEREPQLGGLAAGFRVGPSALEKFYHHIFTTDKTIVGFIDELGLSSHLIWGRPNTSTLSGGRMVSLGGIPDLLRLPLLDAPNRLRLLTAMALLKAIPNERPFDGRTAAQVMPRLMGRRVYDVMWEPVLRGKFGARANSIAMSWLWSRVHERSLRLGYLRGGFQQMYDAFGERIRAYGGAIHTSTAATSIRRADAGIEVATDRGTSHIFEQLLVTLPTRLFMRLAPDLPAEYVQRYTGPEHYGAHVLILGLDRALLNGVYWLNINDRDLPFLALVEHTNFMPPADYGGLHLVYLGNYVPMDHPLFTSTSDADIVSSYLAAVGRIQPRFDPSWVRQHWVFRAPFAQPIVTTDYVRQLPPHPTPLRGVFLANMAHVYPQDRGQNYSLRLGERMARQMLSAP
jgi:protoporphyrinogen oxidase